MGEREANGGSDDHKKHVSFFLKDFICFYCTIYPSFVLFWIEKVMILRVYDCCADGLYLFNIFCYFLIATL